MQTLVWMLKRKINSDIFLSRKKKILFYAQHQVDSFGTFHL